MQNSDLWTRKTSLYGSQTWPVALWLQNSVICFRLTSLYVSQPSSMFFFNAIQRILDQNFKSLWVPPRPHLWFWAHITASLTQEYKDSIGSSPHLCLCACKRATLGIKLQVSERQRPHLWFLHAKQRLLDQSNKSIWVPDMTCRFVHVQQRA